LYKKEITASDGALKKAESTLRSLVDALNREKKALQVVLRRTSVMISTYKHKIAKEKQIIETAKTRNKALTARGQELKAELARELASLKKVRSVNAELREAGRLAQIAQGQMAAKEEKALASSKAALVAGTKALSRSKVALHQENIALSHLSKLVEFPKEFPDYQGDLEYGTGL